MEIEEELPTEMYSMIMEEIQEPETYSAMAKTSRSLRELALEKKSLARAKERFFHGIDPYLYEKSKEIVLSWTPVEYQCDEVNRLKIQEIAEVLNDRIKVVKEEMNKYGIIGGVMREDLMDYISKDCLGVLLNLKHKRSFKANSFRKLDHGLDLIAEAYGKQFKKITLEILQHYDLYDPSDRPPFAEHI